MHRLKDYMSSSTLYELLCSLDYKHMSERDKMFLSNLYEHYQKEKENMEFTDYQYARLNEIDFIQPEYVYNMNFVEYLKPYK